MKRKTDHGQLSLEELFDFLWDDGQVTPGQQETVPGAADTDGQADTYLRKEERILSLAREVKPRPKVVSSGLITQLCKKLDATLSFWKQRDSLQRAARNYIAALWDRAVEDAAAFNELRELLPLEGDEQPEIVKNPIRRLSPVYPASSGAGAGKCLLLGYHKTWSREKEVYLYPGGLKKYARGASWTSGAFTTDVQPFTDMVILNAIIGFAEKNERMRDLLISTLTEAAIGRFREADGKALSARGDVSAEDLRDLITELNLHGISCKEAVGTENKDKIAQFWYLGAEGTFLIGKTHRFSVDDTSGKTDFWKAMLRCLEYVSSELRADKAAEKYRETLTSTARVFETKKNIPPATLLEMERSAFNEYFGYIEYDELTDLNLVKEIYREFESINRFFFKGRKNKDIALRIRLLGRHHAIGLYFPSLRCLCVDVRYPSSFVHEYFHMFDYENGELSRDGKFLDIRMRYEKLLREGFSGMDEGAQKKMKGSKYDLNYYLTPTEVFARCGEIYLARIWCVKNSLIGSTDGFAYPRDKELERLIDRYYSEILDTYAHLPAVITPPADFLAASAVKGGTEQ